MNRVLVFVVFLVVLMKFLGVDLSFLISSFALFMFIYATYHLMLKRRFPPRFLEYLLILILAPYVLISILGKAFHDIPQDLKASHINTSFIFLFFLIGMISFLVFLRRRQRRVDHFELRGVERKPLPPQSFEEEDFDEEEQ